MQFATFSFLLSIGSNTTDYADKDEMDLRIKGGRPTEINLYPSMAAIGWKAKSGKETWIFKCGGTLLNVMFVLTAAHCSSTPPADPTVADIKPKMVRLGTKNILDSFSQDRRFDANIKRFISHPKYHSPNKYFDVALIKLDARVTFGRNIKPACLWSGNEDQWIGKKAFIAGWGKTTEKATKGTEELLAGQIDVLDLQMCDSLLQVICNRHWCGLKDQMCAGKLDGSIDSCSGDSGGPLLVKAPLPNQMENENCVHYIMGVTSFGKECGTPNLPGIYTKVSKVRNWIVENYMDIR